MSKLQRVVIDALREKLYSPANLKAVVAEVRDQLLARAKREEQERLGYPRGRAHELREIQREIDNIKAAVRLGKATETLLGMLEDAERRKEALQRGVEAPAEREVQRRLERVLAELPEQVQAYLEDLEELLANRQIERCKQILAGLGTMVIINPDGTAEIRSDLGKALQFTGPARKADGSLWWLGEEDSNPR